MRIGIFGEGSDPQCAAVAQEASALGADTLYIDSRAMDEGKPLSMLDGKTFYQGEPVDDVKGFYVRSVPVPSVPAMKKDDSLVLYEDWFTAFTQTRERSAYFLAWLLQLSHRGATLVNGPPRPASCSTSPTSSTRCAAWARRCRARSSRMIRPPSARFTPK